MVSVNPSCKYYANTNWNKDSCTEELTGHFILKFELKDNTKTQIK